MNADSPLPPYDPNHAAAPQQYPQQPLPPLAEWWERWAARSIDSVLYAIASSIVSALLFAILGPLLGIRFGIFSSGATSASGYFTLALIVWAASGAAYAWYDVEMHARTGQTLGKMLLKIRVAGLDGRPVPRAVLLRRACAYPGAFAVVGLLAGISWSATTLALLLAFVISIADGVAIVTDQPRRQALHDRFAGTVVTKALDQGPRLLG